MDIIRFFSKIRKLKEIERSGWIVSGVKKPESVADHSFGVALLVMLLGKDKNINLEKALKMALIHDLGEAIIGDIITWKNFHATKEDKEKKEETAMNKIAKDFGETGKEIKKLWEEYREAETPEAKFVKSIDKLEMILQAKEYTENRKNLNPYIETFFNPENLKEVKDKEIKNLLEEIISLHRSKPLKNL